MVCLSDPPEFEPGSTGSSNTSGKIVDLPSAQLRWRDSTGRYLLTAGRPVAKWCRSRFMTRSVHILPVVIALPSDVWSERAVAASVLEELNRSICLDRGLRFEAARWETDTYPGFPADGPQGTLCGRPISKCRKCRVSPAPREP